MPFRGGSNLEIYVVGRSGTGPHADRHTPDHNRGDVGVSQFFLKLQKRFVQGVHQDGLRAIYSRERRDRVAEGGYPPPAPTPPCERFPTRRFKKNTQASGAPRGSSRDRERANSE